MKRYEKYRLNWMIEHGYSITDLIKKLEDYRGECDTNSIESIFCEWECYDGFNGEIWACEDEYNESEGK